MKVLGFCASHYDTPTLNFLERKTKRTPHFKLATNDLDPREVTEKK